MSSLMLEYTRILATGFKVVNGYILDKAYEVGSSYTVFNFENTST